MGREPIQRAAHAIISEHIRRDPPPEQVFNGLVGSVLRDHIQVTVAETPSIENHGRRSGSSAHQLTGDWIVLIQPPCQTDFLAHPATIPT
jgi:hypothetical protein